MYDDFEFEEYECLMCTETFYYEFDWEVHMDNYGHWPECETCPAVFRSWNACNQHMNRFGHWAVRYECETCTKTFLSQHAANQHMDRLRHRIPSVPCETCSRLFVDQPAADQHMKALGHYRDYCKDCDRRFLNENCLRMHLNSRIHRGANISCPFCKTKYTTASGLFHHLERGACAAAPSIKREKILEIVRLRDPHGKITIKQIGLQRECVIEYSVTGQAFNHRRNCWECYLCHRGFQARNDLNKHLNSAAHRQNVYHCPNLSCDKQFSTLAALFNHLESESCAFMKFAKVQQHVDDIIGAGKRIAF